ncbi:MAG: hypothetical protein CW691_02210 [Candidatus Bathyarchaeum sp.]|nr:MAG: hypothetical protein CW691_02210 [Candidatus Bathyarchaeum sp.]
MVTIVQANIIGCDSNWKSIDQKRAETMSDDCALRGKLAFVMGGGKFGTNALRYLTGNGAKVLVVDLDCGCMAGSEVAVKADGLAVCDSLRDGQAAFLVGDAIDLLLFLLETKVPDMVVTAIPGNAVAKVVYCWLARCGMKVEPFSNVVAEVLANIPESLVSFVDESCGVIVVSYMSSGMRCRENCMPPKDVCALTGRPKLVSMDKLLEFSVYDLTGISAILRSRQLTGGLGAIDGKELYSFLERLGTFDKSYTLAIGTACDCHGVINLVKVTK